MVSASTLARRLALPLVLLATAASHADSFTTCAQVATYLGNTGDRLPQRQKRLAEAIAFANSIADDPSQKCADPLVDRLFYAYAKSLDDYSTSSALQNAQYRRNWASSAAQEWRKYVHWFVGLPTVTQDKLVSAWSGGAEESDMPEARRSRWLPKRIGGALEAMIAASLRAGEQAVMLEALEQETVANADIASGTVLLEWNRWLRVQPTFAAIEPSDDIVAGVIRSNSVARLRWTGFADFLGRYLPSRDELKAKWGPILQTVKGWLAP